MEIEFEAFLKTWEKFIRRTARNIYSRTMSVEDLEQEARIVLWEIFQRYGADYSGTPKIIHKMLPRRLRRLVYDREQKRVKEELTLDAPLNNEEEDGDTRVALQEGENDIMLLTEPDKPLSPREAEVLLMKGLQGLSSDEVAAILGISSHTVRRFWTRARDKLRSAGD